MGSVKSFLSLVIFFLIIFSLPNSVSAFPNYKVAVLPIINTANLKDTEVSDLIEYKIHRKLRFPFYEFIPTPEISGAIKTFNSKNGSILADQTTLSFLSQTLSADIVLVVEILRARADLENHFSFWKDDDRTIENTEVLLKCYAYSAKDNKYSIIKVTKSTSAPLSVDSGLLHAADAVINDLLKKLPFETIPNPTSTEH